VEGGGLLSVVVGLVPGDEHFTAAATAGDTRPLLFGGSRTTPFTYNRRSHQDPMTMETGV